MQRMLRWAEVVVAMLCVGVALVCVCMCCDWRVVGVWLGESGVRSVSWCGGWLGGRGGRGSVVAEGWVVA